MSKKTPKFYRDELIVIMENKKPYNINYVAHSNCHSNGGYFGVLVRFNDGIVAGRNVDDHDLFTFKDIFTAQKFYKFAINKMHESQRL